jgi:uncharacterized phiE125 gp8 family phage protein
MALRLTSAPAAEPLTVAEAKAHLRIDSANEDTLLASLILTSRLHLETALGSRSSRRAGGSCSTAGR